MNYTHKINKTSFKKFLFSIVLFLSIISLKTNSVFALLEVKGEEEDKTIQKSSITEELETLKYGFELKFITEELETLKDGFELKSITEKLETLKDGFELKFNIIFFIFIDVEDVEILPNDINWIESESTTLEDIKENVDSSLKGILQMNDLERNALAQSFLHTHFN